MKSMETLIKEVEIARQQFISITLGLSLRQSEFNPNPEVWSITEIVEHIVWAERAGVMGIWKALIGIRNGKPIWEGKDVNKGLSIEEVIKRTWEKKEKVPEIAKPRWGGPIEFWITSLESCSSTLKKLSRELNGMDLEGIIYSHPISGPLNVIQRMQFLRFHLQRHQLQMENLKKHPQFPMS